MTSDHAATGRLTIDGCSLAMTAEGVADGPALVLLHMLGAAGTMWHGLGAKPGRGGWSDGNAPRARPCTDPAAPTDSSARSAAADVPPGVPEPGREDR